ncbi:hypothetical protein [Archangium primigenium]|uniref:hypothetical protein n=1 Tax=[Archangium] primigenium TaxID=2792470 RepID=UPI0019590639|nr:hypothetical protein [Archangium primigenium]MBM7117021.1 hypothetical protein [Archangium primigenium]
MRMRRGIAITLTLVVVLLLAVAIPYGVRELRIDGCLDASGAWDEHTARCVFAKP